ncbi:MAG: YigZ family protein, partial [Bacteroidota bacterium]
MSDQYKTLAAPSTGEFKDRGSKFFAYAFPVETETEVATALEQVKKEHFKARHHCYAYRLGMDKNNFRANDDGEPSGMAGRPILGQIDSWELTDVFIVVVRYFGGTKLGTSGLINAYKKSAMDALEQAEIIT